jgi:rhamnulokinase
MGSTSHSLLAVDLGAGSVRVMLGRLTDGLLELHTAHRFPHQPRMQQGRLRWDWDGIISAVRRGLAVAAGQTSDAPIVSLSCSSWAQDFGLLDADGKLLFAPVSYRDGRTSNMPHSFAHLVSPDELVRRVGSVVSPLTTICQLRAMSLQEPDLLERAGCLLHVADLVHHHLSGAHLTDRTMSTASQLRSLYTGQWDVELLEALSIPHGLLPDVAEQPALIGHVAADRAPHPGLSDLPVISSAGHDTAAACEVLPSVDEGAAVLSSGTWSMVGCLTDNLVVPENLARDELFLTGLARGRWGLFRGLMGMWLLQECMRAWRGQGVTATVQDLTQAAEDCGCPDLALIDPDAPQFVAPGDMPHKIHSFCVETGQKPPTTPAETVRVILTSLALNCRLALDTLQDAVRTRFLLLRIVGGGSANSLACQLISDATGLPVVAGPPEATAVGNLVLQAQVMGLLAHEQVPELLERSFILRRYEPGESREPDLHDRFRQLNTRGKP